MSQSLPEIGHLVALLDWLDTGPANAKRGVASQIATWYGGHISIEDQFEAHASLVAIIHSLPALIEEQFGEDGRRTTALATVEKLRNILSPQIMAHAMDAFLSVTVNDRQFVKATLPLFQDMRFGVAEFEAGVPEILKKISEFRANLQKSEGLSHASLVVIDAQMAIVERSVEKFSTGGVGGFRDAIFTSIGKIIVELKTNDSNSEAAVREVLDDVIRIYDVLEIGGKLVKIGAPVIAGYLAAPQG